MQVSKPKLKISCPKGVKAIRNKAFNKANSFVLKSVGKCLLFWEVSLDKLKKQC